MVGRGPILNYENRIRVICETNLNDTLPLGELFPDEMINPTANLAFSFN